MSEFVRRSLMDVVSFIVDNRGRSCPVEESGFPLIATNCLVEGRRDVVPTKVRYVSEETRATWFRAHPEPGDVLLVCKGNAGRVAVVPDPVPYCIAQDMVALRADQQKIHPLYLYYRLAARDVQDRIAGMHVGSLIPHFKKGDFKNLHFEMHVDLEEQRRIAELLGALDDLIECNRRLIADQLSLATTYFSTADLQGSRHTFGERADIFGGGTPSTKEPLFWDGDVNWATPTDVTRLTSPFLFSTARSITDAGLAGCSSSLYPAGSILMTSRATIGSFAIAQEPSAVNQGFIVVVPRSDEERTFLLLEMMSRVPEFVQQASGTTFLELSRGKFKGLPVTWPAEAELARLHKQIGPTLAAGAALQAEVDDLTQTRNELLPLLMSGRLQVHEVKGLAA